MSSILDLFGVGDPALGQQLADDAIARVGAHANPNWKAAAAVAVRTVARAHKEFTVDAVWAELGRKGVPCTHDARAMGYIMTQAVKEGVCEKLPYSRKTGRASNHARPLTVWKSLL